MALKPIPSAEQKRLVDRLEQLLSGVPLPESGETLRQRALGWLDRAWVVSHGDVGRLSENVERLAGFSGAELGVAVVEHVGAADPYESMREEIARKLLLAPPLEPNFRMKIAHAFKDEARQAFLDRFQDVGCAVDAAAVRCVEEGRHLEGGEVVFGRPWMGRSMSPQCIFLIAGRRYLVDFKISVRDNAPFEAPTKNVFRLHAEKMFVEAHGLSVAGMIVAKYCPNENDFFELLPLEVEYDQEKTLALIEAGDRFWKMRCEGVLPPPSALPRLRVRDLGDLRQLADRFAVCDAIASQAYREGSAAKGALVERLSAVSLDSGLHGLGAVSVQVTKQLDIAKAVRELGPLAEGAREKSYAVSKMVAYLESIGADMSQFSELGALDESKLRLLLKERCLPTSRFERQVVSLGLDRRPSGLGSELKRRAAGEVVLVRDKLLPVAMQEPADMYQPAKREVGRPAPGM